MHKLLSAAQCAHKHCAIFDHKGGKQILNNRSSAKTTAYFYALEKITYLVLILYALSCSLKFYYLY